MVLGVDCLTVSPNVNYPKEVQLVENWKIVPALQYGANCSSTNSKLVGVLTVPEIAIS